MNVTPGQVAARQLCSDLGDQLRGISCVPAVIAVDRNGEVLEKSLFSLDTGGRPISDAEYGRAVAGMFESRHPGAVAAWGFVRIDVVPPEITVAHQDGIFEQLRPEIEDGEFKGGWLARQGSELEDEPRGGDEDAFEDDPDSAYRADAETALRQILSDALQQLQGAVEQMEPASVSEVPNDGIYDLGFGWGHVELPEAPPDQTLLARLSQLRGFAENLPTEVSCFRFVYGDRIYLYAVFLRDGGESSGVFSTSLAANGELLQMEPVAPQDLE